MSREKPSYCTFFDTKTFGHNYVVLLGDDPLPSPFENVTRDIFMDAPLYALITPENMNLTMHIGSQCRAVLGLISGRNPDNERFDPFSRFVHPTHNPELLARSDCRFRNQVLDQCYRYSCAELQVSFGFHESDVARPGPGRRNAELDRNSVHVLSIIARQT